MAVDLSRRRDIRNNKRVTHGHRSRRLDFPILSYPPVERVLFPPSAIRDIRWLYRISAAGLCGTEAHGR